jgi:hypothetical protein
MVVTVTTIIRPEVSEEMSQAMVVRSPKQQVESHKREEVLPPAVTPAEAKTLLVAQPPEAQAVEPKLRGARAPAETVPVEQRSTSQS